MLDYALVARVRMDLEREADRLRSEANREPPYVMAELRKAPMLAARYATAAEACSQAEHALFHVLNTLTHELDDAQAEEALKSHA